MIFYCITANLSAQDNPKQDLSWVWEKGTPLITHYTPEDYKASVQNWCFMQGDNGMMYVGNMSGLLEFDGVHWRLLTIPNGSPVKSMAKRRDGTIFVGAVRDLGYLKPGSTGEMKFVSLLGNLDTAYQDFADIWFTFATKDIIYFVSDDYIFKWNGREFQVWEATERFGWAWLIKDQLYIQRKQGIFRLEQDSLKLIPGGNLLKNLSITVLLPFRNDKLLVVDVQKGPYVYDHGQLHKLKNETSALLIDKSLFGGVVLSNKGYALNSANGLFILDTTGLVKQQLTQKNGMNSNVVIGLYEDRKGMLWLATENGISRAEIGSSLRTFNKTNNLKEYINEVAVHNGRLYAACNDGLYYLKNNYLHTKQHNLFVKVPQIKNQTWDIESTPNGLLIGNFNGLWLLGNDGVPQMIQDENTYDLLKSPHKPGKVFTGTTLGNVYELNLINNKWTIGKDSVHIRGRIYRMSQGKDGDLWLGTRYSGIYRIRWGEKERSFSQKYKVTHYDTATGLPSPDYNIIKIMDGKTYAVLPAGMFRFETARNTFAPDPYFTRFQRRLGIDQFNEIFPAGQNGYWVPVTKDYEYLLYRFINGSLVPFQKGERFSGFILDEISDQGGKVVLFSGNKGIIAFNREIRENLGAIFPVHIRQVLIHNDSLIFAGHELAGRIKNISIPFQKSAIRFAYALPAFDQPEANQYQTFLEGFDEGWSAWGTETQRDFTNLTEGDYIFRVRAKNIYGEISQEDNFAFTITPPLHRTWWAFLLYGLAIAGIIILLVQWRYRKLQNEKLALENIVAQRTRQLARQAGQLKALDSQKSRFFANISHEFRTPLTLIKGPVEYIQAHPSETLTPGHIEMINRNANRLLRLVNQLLDLSKLDAETLHLEPKTGDIYQFLRVLAASFSSHAERREMHFQIEIPQQSLVALFDHDKLEKIVYNLLSNAFKFTPDRGKVALSAFLPDQMLEIRVSDTGKGIAADRLAHIFDRFYQIDDSDTRKQEGSGIGLALTKELVSLMEGSISVKSMPKGGTIFTVKLPLKVMTTPERKASPYHPSPPPLGGANGGRKKQPSAGTVHPDSVETGENCLTLIVEDNSDMRGFIKAQLDEGYQLLEASDGKQGWEIAVSEIPDLVITDLMMPVMDGVALCRKLKTDERTSHIPVIMLTAKAGLEHKIEGLKTGADSYLTKPFDRQELQVRVKNLITQRRQLRQRYSKTGLSDPRPVAISSLDEQFLQKIKELLEDNFSDAGFGVPQMQDAMAMSKTQFHRKMKALTDQPPGELLRNFRLKRAAQILSQKGDSVTQVAYAVGFNNLSYFAKCFKALYGVAPSAYRSVS